MAQAALPRSGRGQFQHDDRTDPDGWYRERQDLLRALAAGAIVGMPLLYTMEVWWHGMALPEWHLLFLLAAILGANFLFSLLSGFRNDDTVGSAVFEAITSVGLGILFSTVILWVIGEFKAGQAMGEIMGRVLMEAAPVSMGVSFANAQLRGRSRTGDDQEDEEGAGSGAAAIFGQRTADEDDPERRQLRADLKDAAATLAGASVFALNIAPTEEVLMIATRVPYWQVVVMLLVGLLLCYVILFASGFEEHEVYVRSLFQHPVAETLMVCSLSLIVAAILLVLMGQREILTHPSTFCASVVTLGLPAIVGGAAGRLII